MRNAGSNLSVREMYRRIHISVLCRHASPALLSCPPPRRTPRRGDSRIAPKPPLCKGRWHAFRRDGGVVSIPQSFARASQMPAPFTQGGLWVLLLPENFFQFLVKIAYIVVVQPPIPQQNVKRRKNTIFSKNYACKSQHLWYIYSERKCTL